MYRIPIRTHIITEKDDIVSVVKKYIENIAEPGDIVAIAESVVAITQGRAYLPKDVKVGMLARFLCRFPQRHGSLTSPQSMQLAINESGCMRILLAAGIGAIGKLFKKRGWFFKVAGKQVALIDDVAGTMPPYHRHIVLGPKDPNKVCDAIKKATGIDAIIVDANDIGCADIVGFSSGIGMSIQELVNIFRENPAGNSDQQTPIVLLKNAKQKKVG